MARNGAAVQKKPAGKSENDKPVAENRKARFNYFIEETVEAGIVLQGTEVKSIRQGKVNLQDGFARVEDGELWLHNVHIAPYEQGNRFNHEPTRNRKLLVHKEQILQLAAQLKQQGLTLVPLKMYLKRGRVKVLIGLARGKKQHDKRETIMKRDVQREIQRALRTR